ncbi:hemerythrin family protein [Curvibacter sp. APW13]|uniref:bacteriohemerythrin n=1 Tax=Curvibacter sp. APW13 TaxID=3077236 RepID=UPI0028E06754|nr:hemerythrin family protein [Curvibacter sp. APW13]MDT8991300.1 hemerythrin family protein [Curvibacter sp. APW13]
MALFIWTHTLSTGNSHIDDDHRLLVEKVNTVLECIANRADNATLAAAMDTLGQFTREHFGYEDSAMRKLGYAKAQEHTAQHTALLQQLDQTLAQLRANEPIDQMALYNRLTRWVIDHIQTFDRDFVLAESALATQD